MRILKTALTFLFLSQATSLFAQTSEESDATQTQKITSLAPAYEKQMLRLSEVLGALHYIRELCNANEGQQWRDQMELLIKEEQPTQEQKAQLIANFNNGFRGFQESYRECTPSAIEANNRYITEGLKLSGEIPARFGR